VANLPLIDHTQATGEAATLLTDLRKKIGPVPNMAKAMANSPAVLKGWIEFSGALAAGSLTSGDRERIALATAEYNRCTYCLSAHSFLAEKVAKLPESEIEAARHAESSDPHSAALLTLADAINRTRGSIDETDLKAARAADVTDAEITEVVANVALSVLTNYFNIVADTDTDNPAIVRPHNHH
jgi:uncharacterized peroxidase-related enzyme